MKYLMEEKIDFFAELNNLDKDNPNHADDKDETNICLITCEQLMDKYITLNCGHKFNYIPLYKDIFNHKQKFNSMESRSNHLKLDELRCPYCRKKQVGILPYYEEFGLEKINGVNIIYESKNIYNYSFVNKYCVFIMNESEKEELKNGETFIPKICNYNKMVKLENDFKDNPWYCGIHKKIIIAKEKKLQKEKEKQEKEKEKQEKKKEKQEIEKLLKLELKLKKEKKVNKENKENSNSLSKVDELNNMIQEENEIIQISLDTCICLLKTGPNKGKPCGSKKVYMNSLCKRHFI